MSATRLEHDLLGDYQVPVNAYWGVHTARAVDNFPISGVPIGHYRSLIKALAIVKQATAQANFELGELSAEITEAISKACQEVAEGKFDNEFVVDAIQGGAGTSTNMNANEVIANRAIEILGGSKGDYNIVHPLNHVNKSQSTNDVYPTALKLALILEINELLAAMAHLQDAFQGKADEFKDVIKMGRTQLQDAVPMTLGQEFATFSRMTMEDIQRLQETIPLLREINLPPRQAGSSIMPGKVNPVIPEVVNQIAFAVIGNDVTVTMAAEAGQLQLNAFEPIMCRALMMSITQLRQGCYVLADACVSGITANVEKLRLSVEHSIGLVTVISPVLGYENATIVAQKALADDTSVREVVLELGLMTEAQFDELLGNIDALVRPRTS